MVSLARELPITEHRTLIEDAVKANQVTVLVGETGSGKTTRVPLYLYEAGLAHDGRIGVTQPRRIAAISVAEYVASRLGCRIGEEVGFQIRFNDVTTEGTKIKFMTDGILLQEAKSDPMFSRYDVLVFDEAHERGLNTDFCLGLAKRALAKRPELKVVVMSATIDAEKFAAFFSNAPIIRIEGRMFPVEVRYFERADAMEAKNLLNPKRGQEVEAFAAFAVDRIHRSGSPGDILVFMPGEAEIHRTIRMIEDFNHSGITVFPVFGNMSPDDQRRIFSRTRGRKVVVATNIAETSITIDGVVHVVDSGLIRESDFNPATGIGSLKVVEHSKAGLEQRKGRAGRTQPGVCWRLFGEEEFKKGRYEYRGNWNEGARSEFTKPEIQRSDLAGVVLRLIGIGIKDLENFELPDMPTREAIVNAVVTLQAIGALTPSFDITPLGEKLLDLPVEPKIGRMIIAAEEFGCVKEVIVIAAKLSVRDLHYRPKDKEVEADAAKQKFQDKRSDLLGALAVMRAYEEHGLDRRWAGENFLNWKAIEELISIREQLRDILRGLGVEVTSVGYHLPKDQYALTEEETKQGEAIGKAVTAGLIQNFTVAGWRHSHRRAGGDIVNVHPSSALFRATPRLFVSGSVVKTTGQKGEKTYARDLQEVKAEWLKEVAPQAVRRVRTPPRKSLFSEEYRVSEQLFFNDLLVEEKEIPAEGSEVSIQIAQDILTGDLNLGCEFANRETLRRIEQIHIASEGKTKKPLTRGELKEFYIAGLEGATSVAEARTKNLLIVIRDFVSEEEEEEYDLRISYTRHYLTEATPVSIYTPPAVQEIDAETELRIEGLQREVREIVRNPSLYGYEGGWGLRNKMYQLEGEPDQIRRAFRRGENEEGERLIAALSADVRRAHELRSRREERQAKKLEVAVEQEREAEARAKIELDFAEYEKRVADLKTRCGSWQGFGVYTFPVDERGEPQDYRSEDGTMIRFDWENTEEVLPEKGRSYWGFITQHGHPAKVALLMEVMEKPVHITIKEVKKTK